MGFIGYIFFIAQMGTMYRVLVSPGFFVHQYNLKMKDMVEPTYVCQCFNDG